MNDSPESNEPGRRRASGAILAELRAATPKRRLALVVLCLVVPWCGLTAALELSQAFRFWWVDPFGPEQTALWMPVNGPAEALEAAAVRLRTCLPEDAGDREIAVRTFRGQPDDLYWFLWLAAELPQFEWRLVRPDDDFGAARYLLTEDSSAVPDAAPLCFSHPLRLDALSLKNP